MEVLFVMFGYVFAFAIAWYFLILPIITIPAAGVVYMVDHWITSVTGGDKKSPLTSLIKGRGEDPDVLLLGSLVHDLFTMDHRGEDVPDISVLVFVSLVGNAVLLASTLLMCTSTNEELERVWTFDTKGSEYVDPGWSDILPMAVDVYWSIGYYLGYVGVPVAVYFFSIWSGKKIYSLHKMLQEHLDDKDSHG